MAPRTRSGRSFNVQRPDSNDLKSQILELPDEIYLEIASHVPATPVPTDYTDKSVDLKACSARHATLASLCQACRTLRRIFLRYLWERIEVLEGMPTESGDLLGTLKSWEAETGRNTASRVRHDAKAKKFATELVRQLEIVTVRDPTLAQYVRIVNVVITDYSIAYVLQELARCLSYFTNLHTLQISFLPPGFSRQQDLSSISWAFSNRVYPHIQNLYLSPTAPSMILRVCPNVRHFSWRIPGNLYTVSRVQTYSLEPLPKLEIFETVLMNNTIASSIPEYVPNVREIILDLRGVIPNSGFIALIGDLKPLSELQHLHNITIKVQKSEEVTPGSLPQWVTWGWQIFTSQKNSGNIKKTLVLIYEDNIRETYIISGNKVPTKLL